MRRRRFLGLAAGAAGLAAWPRLARGEAAVRPNVLLLVTDDWGWPFYGFMRSQVSACMGAPRASCDPQADPSCQPFAFPFPRTPNLDALVDGGICFPLGLATAPKSAWSRESIQSGLNRRDLPKDGTFFVQRTSDIAAGVAAGGRVTIPVALEGLGYKTYALGKWEVGGAGSLSSFFSHNPPGSGVESIESTNLQGPELLAGFLDGPAQGPEPWFVLFAPEIPHTPYITGASYDYDAFSAALLATCGPKPIALSDSLLRRFLASCSWFDTMLGEVIAVLEARGLRETTLLFYAADHGAGLVRGKANFTEAGLRTPILASCPAPLGTPWRIPPRGLHPALVGTIDLFPTILDYAREGQAEIPSWVPDPADTARFPDGRSFRAIASGLGGSLPTLQLSNMTPGGDVAVREAAYDPGSGALLALHKLYVSKAGKEKQLYDLLGNPFENPKQNLVKQPEQAARIAALKQAVAQW